MRVHLTGVDFFEDALEISIDGIGDWQLESVIVELQPLLFLRGHPNFLDLVIPAVELVLMKIFFGPESMKTEITANFFTLILRYIMEQTIKIFNERIMLLIPIRN
ncbi:hypothetical protein AVEN_216645-1 [Araneus ventricosus]|uniref:Uncharacterized protein n=1 Tax=Araneus ventricosus TaxID=182803 RepID=A0A4Y2DTP0_ARAVE|nr:hypothetical protein AVEN_216645-1 [Araneus ventricosus]